MKKRYKTLILMGAGAAIYGTGVMMGVSLFDGSLSLKANQPETVASKLHAPTNNSEKLSKWLTNIQPAAGGNE
jgi:hypothetical protein